MSKLLSLEELKKNSAGNSAKKQNAYKGSTPLLSLEELKNNEGPGAKTAKIGNTIEAYNKYKQAKAAKPSGMVGPAGGLMTERKMEIPVTPISARKQTTTPLPAFNTTADRNAYRDNLQKQANGYEQEVNKHLAGWRANAVTTDPALTEANKKLNDARKQLEQINRLEQAETYGQEYLDGQYNDNFIGQTKANYAVGRMSQDSSMAWNAYLNNPTEANRKYAERIDEVMQKFREANTETLADDATLPWLSQSFAQYVPQLMDQTKAGAAGAIGGAVVGGTVVPGVGALGGARAGYTAGVGMQSYDLMRGAAFKSLIDAGVDEETALRAANDEALISSLVEMGDAAVDIMTLGGLSALKGGISGAFKTAAGDSAKKKAMLALTNYGINIGSEGLEEAVQEAVSIGNARRIADGDMSLNGLVGHSFGVGKDAITGRDMEARGSILDAAKEGAKVSAVMAGADAVVSRTGEAYRKYLDAKKGTTTEETEQLNRTTTQNPVTVHETAISEELSNSLAEMRTQHTEVQKKPQAMAVNKKPIENPMTAKFLANEFHGEGRKVVQEKLNETGNTKVIEQAMPFYTGALSGQSFESIRNKYATTATTDYDYAKAVFDAGLADREADVVARMKGRGKFAKSKGVILDDVAITEAQKALANYVSKVGGMTIRVVETADNDNGVYDRNKNEILIALDSQYGFTATLFHETVHFIKAANAEGYQKLQDTVFRMAAKLEGKPVEVFMREYKQTWEKDSDRTYGAFDVMEEMTADAMMKIASDANGMKELVNALKGENPTVLEQLKEFIDKLLQALEDLVKDRRFAEFAEAIHRDIENTRELRKLFAEELKVAGEYAKANTEGETKKQPEEQTDAKHSKKLGGYFPEIVISTESVEKLGIKNIRYVKDVIDKVCDSLRGKFLSEGDFAKPIVNIDTGMEICVYKGGIGETFGKKEAYADLSDEWKMIKIAVASELGKIIKYAEVRADDAPNAYNENSDTVYAYFRAPVIVDGREVTVDIDIKKTNRGDRFYMHKIKVADSSPKAADKRPKSKAKLSADESVAQQNTVDNSEIAENVGVQLDDETGSAYPIKRSARTWSKTDYVNDAEKAAQEMANKLDISVKQARKYIRDVNSIAATIASDRVRLDYEGAEGSAFVSNSEYGGSIDMSTICKKRRWLTGTLSAIQRALPNTALTEDEILDIRNRMKERDYEVSCGLCYVEGSRTKMGMYTKQFIEMYAKTNPPYVPDMAEMNTPEGLLEIKATHPEVYEKYEYFYNHGGRLKDGDPYLFASQQKPKLFQMATAYDGDILKKFGFVPSKKKKKNEKDLEADEKRRKKKGAAIRKKNLFGGLRIQSFSDFEIIHLIDMMQVIMDMARVGLAGQAYTKVPDFAWALGDTGLKINLSLIAKGVDENGKLILDDVEGMPQKDAKALRDRYSDNVGTIIVVFNDEQLKAAMADDFIDFIIPFHRSQWSAAKYVKMGLPGDTRDYTNFQSEKFIEEVTKTTKAGKVVKVKAKNLMPNSYWDFSKTGKENAERYLEICASTNRRPKFSHLLVDNGDGSYSLQDDGSTDGYWKLLIDFKMYNNEGKGVPQMPVKPDFNMEQAERMLREYEGGHEKFPVAQDVVDEFVEEYKSNNEGKKFSRRTTEDLKQENAELKKANENLRGIFNVIGRQRITETSAKEVAAAWLKNIGSSYDKDEFARKFKIIAEHMADARNEYEAEDAVEAMKNLAMEAMRKSEEVDTAAWEENKDLYNKVKSTKLFVSDDVAEDLKAYGGYASIVRGTYGKMDLSRKADKGVTDIDVLYGELNAENELLFPYEEGMTKADMLMNIADGMESLQPVMKNKYGYTAEEMAEDVVYDLFDRMGDLTYRTSSLESDLKSNEKYTQLKAEYEKRIAKVRREAEQQREKYESDAEARYARLKDRHKEQRINREMKKARETVERESKRLLTWLTGGTDKNHVPENMRVAVEKILTSITTKDARINQLQLIALKDVYGEHGPEGESGDYLEYDPDVTEILKKFTKQDKYKDGVIVLDDLSLEEMQNLSKMIRSLKHTIQKANKWMGLQRDLNVAEICDNQSFEWDNVKDATTYGAVRQLHKYFGMSMADANVFFKEFGKVAHETVWRGLRTAFDKKINFLAEAEEFSKGIDQKQVAKWRAMPPQKFELPSGDIWLTPTQVMSLYCLAKREDAKRHLYGGGMKAAAFKFMWKLGAKFPKEAMKQYAGRRVTEADINAITATLTDEQRATADKIQKFMVEHCAKWGNATSMLMFGYMKFGDPNYFPIRVDGDTLTSSVGDPQLRIKSIQNTGAAMPIDERAKNALVLEDIFSVLASHVEEMSSYAAFVPALSDLNKFVNYKVRNENGEIIFSMKTAIGQKVGPDAMGYIYDLLETLNGSPRSAKEGILPKTLVRNAKTASVAANLRVIAQQPTAYLRAGIVLDMKYLLQGMTPGKVDKEEVFKYCPIARWKAMGNYDMNIGKTVEQLVTGQTMYQKIIDKSMAGAGWADSVTWGWIWKACKAETADKYPELKGEEFLIKAGERMSEVIDDTQVVDSPLHRSQMMRNKSLYMQMITSYMSEPTKAVGLVASTVIECRKNPTKENKKKVMRTWRYLIATGILTAAFAGVADMFRDDDEDEEMWEKFLQAFWGDQINAETPKDRAVALLGSNIGDNLNPLNSLPLMRDVLSMLQGYEITRTDFAWMADIMNNIGKWNKYLSGESEYTLTALLGNTAQSLSKVTGMPIKSAARELDSVRRAVVGHMSGDVQYKNAKITYSIGSEKNISRYVSMMLEARMNGDKTLAKKIYNEMIKAGIDNETIDKKIDSVSKKALESEPEVANGAEAYKEGDYDALIGAIDSLNKKGYSEKNAADAITKAYNKKYGEEEDEELTYDEITESYWDEELEESPADYQMMENAFVSGNMDDYNEMWSVLKMDKYKEANMKTTMKKRLKKIYHEPGTSPADKARIEKEYTRLDGRLKALRTE